MFVIQVDEKIVNILTKATRDGLAMASVKPIPVGLSRYVNSNREVSAIVGFVGSTSGAIMVNASSSVACFLTKGLLGEEYETITAQVLDSMCEIANIIAGQTKAFLSNTEWKIDKISCPSIVVGSSYFVSHYKGMQTTSVEFELPEMPLAGFADRIFSVAISLIKI
jgi:CheY-specific phosphatase CheX